MVAWRRVPQIMCDAAQCGSLVSCCSCCRELVHHSRLQGHPHIIGMREAYLTNDHLCVVMDYADGGDLAEHLSRHVYSTVRRRCLLNVCIVHICPHVVVWRDAQLLQQSVSALERYTELSHSCSYGRRTAASRRMPHAGSSSSWCPHSTGCTAQVRTPARSLFPGSCVMRSTTLSRWSGNST